uniref:Expressed protein n=2 Tax=Schizophyllum commune (strain H4-8 / FGSC 9210) TaxID=578458 RepID=D8PV86_SCHCM
MRKESAICCVQDDFWVRILHTSDLWRHSYCQKTYEDQPDGRHHLAYALSFVAHGFRSLRSIAAVPRVVEASCYAWVLPSSFHAQTGRPTTSENDG